MVKKLYTKEERAYVKGLEQKPVKKISTKLIHCVCF
jgi:hypothetical protein